MPTYSITLVFWIVQTVLIKLPIIISDEDILSLDRSQLKSVQHRQLRGTFVAFRKGNFVPFQLTPQEYPNRQTRLPERRLIHQRTDAIEFLNERGGEVTVEAMTATP